MLVCPENSNCTLILTAPAVVGMGSFDGYDENEPNLFI